MIFRRGIFFLLALSTLLSFESFSLDIPGKTGVKKNKDSHVDEPKDKHKRFLSLDEQLVVRPGQAFYTEPYAVSVSPEEDSLRKKIEATYNRVLYENRFVDFLDENTLVDLPVGLKTNVGVLTYTILVDSIVMTPRESFLYVSMVFETPLGKKIHFRGSDIKFSKAGGITGDGKLMLVGDYPINYFGDNSRLLIKGSAGKTFVEFDCSGFKQLSLDASLLFSRNILLPEDGDGNIIPDKNISIDFTTTVSDWSDLLIDVTIPTFQVNGIKDVSFTVTNATLDFSDLRNPANITFPKGYPSGIGGNTALWQGVYLRALTVKLPPQFETNNEGNDAATKKSYRVSFTGTDVILDNVGFTGKVVAANIIPLSKGKIGNWNFSMESISIDVVANEIKEGIFSGKINLPLSKPVTEQNTNLKEVFSYKAVIKPGNEYSFTVSNADVIKFDLWKAHVTLDPSSFVEVKLADGKFRPKAHLNGKMAVLLGLKDDGETDGNDDKNIKLAEITFESLELQSVKPYIKVGNFSLGHEGGKSGMGGFPLQVKSVFGGSSGNTIYLGVDITLALVGEGDGGFAAEGKFRIVSEGIEHGNNLAYHFKRIEIERLSINIDKGPFKFKGTLNFYKNDAMYGNGISGTVDATFEPAFQLQASAIFGTKDGMRYWFADALLTLKKGIPIYPPIAFYSFGGGAFFHMRIDTKGEGSALGRTVSGIVYVPDATISFGLKATVGLGFQAKKETFNADVTFEMAFNTGGGLRYINFLGNGYFLSSAFDTSLGAMQDKVSKLVAVTKKTGMGMGNLNEGSGSESAAQEINGSPQEAGSRAMIWSTSMINYDFESRTLHSTMKTYINIAGGLMKGGGPNGQAGEAVLHIAPNEWYIYIGRPEYENRFSLEVLGIARMDSYFVMGSVVPDTPGPPEEIASILGLQGKAKSDLDYMKDLNALQDGAGIGFGSSFRFDTGDITFLMFYGRFRAGFGFDAMLKDYGEVYCKGNKPLGINGWYANTQAYGYFEGKIGIKVKIFGKKKRINILEISTATLLQSALPNPVWMKGIIGGHFSALGGLVHGSCKFEIQIGHRCELMQDHDDSILETVEVLAQTTPRESEVKVDVFTVPQAIFNYEMERQYEMVDVQEKVVKFKISLDAFTLKNNGTPIQAELIWNDDKTVAALNPSEILPSEQELELVVVTSFKEMKNGYWIVSTVDGEKLTKTYSIKFKTDKAPDHIPASNIAYSYPSVNQFNYYKDESAEVYIKLKQGQRYLFNDAALYQVMRFTTTGGQPVNVPFTYLADAKEVRANTRDLVTNHLYELKMVNMPKGPLGKTDANVITSSTQSEFSADVDIQTRSATTSLTDAQETEIYTTHFRTSQYNTFHDKIVGVNPSAGWRDPVVPGVHIIGSNIGGPEPFSYEEIYGSAVNEPFIQMEADLDNVSWYHSKVFPLVYENYPLEGSIRIRPAYNRDPDVLGIIPIKAVQLYQYPYKIALTDDAITTGIVPNFSAGGRFDYLLSSYMYYDFLDLAGQAANYVVNTNKTSTNLDRLLTGTFPVITKGDYWINIHYVLPGRKTVTSTYKHKIYNPID